MSQGVSGLTACPRSCPSPSQPVGQSTQPWPPGLGRGGRPSSATPPPYARPSARKESRGLGRGGGAYPAVAPPAGGAPHTSRSGPAGTPRLRASPSSQPPGSARQPAPQRMRGRSRGGAGPPAPAGAPRRQSVEVPEGEEAVVERPLAYTPHTLLTRPGYEDVHTTCFLTTLREETLENELAGAFRDRAERIGAPFHRVRSEALSEALQHIRSIAICAAVEAQQSQATAAAAAGVGGGLGTIPPPEEAFLPPFNAIRAAMTAGGPAAVATTTGDGKRAGLRRDASYESETWSRAQRALRSSDLTSCVFRRVLVLRNEVRASMNMGAPVSVALTTEEALAWTTLRQQVELSPLEKLQQQSRELMSRNHNNNHHHHRDKDGKSPGAAHKVRHHPGEGDEAGARKTMTPYGMLVSVPDKTVYDMMTAVTYEEQEIALRFLQGLCLTMNHQRRCVAEGCLFHYATEVFQCLLQHVEAVFSQRRRLRLNVASNSTNNGPGSASALRGTTFAAHAGANPRPGAASPPAGPSLAGTSLYLATPITVGSGAFSGPSATHGNRHESPLPPNSDGGQAGLVGSPPLLPSTLRGGGDTALAARLDSSPVEVEEGQVMVLVALVDTIEAACHYNPTCLTRLVQTGGVTAMLNLVYSPCVPESIRAALLDTISVLMQEVAPFRRAVAVGSPPQQQQQHKDGDGNAVGGSAGAGGRHANTAAEDGDLLAIMVEQAVTGAFHNPGADSAGDAPPYMMDRASASKFDSAVREWFSRHGLSHVVTGVMELRGVRGWWRLWGDQQQQHLHHHHHAGAAAGGTGGGSGGAAGGGAGALSQVSIETTRARQRATQQHAANISALLQAIDGKRADLRKT